MKHTDKQLKQLFTDHPIQAHPVKKEAFLAEVRNQQINYPLTEKSAIKKPIRKPLLIAAMALLSLTMLISAGSIAYFYRVPGGDLVDESGNVRENPENTDSAVNDRSIRINDNTTIISVTWAQAEHQTTLAAWVNNGSSELIGLRAIVDGVEYPLEKKTFNLNGGQIGYTAVDVPKPDSLVLRCDSPGFEKQVTFAPENIVSECTVGSITLFGSAVANTIYLGVSDPTYLDDPLFEHAELSFISTIEDTSYTMDNRGNTYSSVSGGSATRSDTFLTFQKYDIPPENRIVSHYTDSIRMVFWYPEADKGNSPSVKVPLPGVGESIEGHWPLINESGFSYVITEVSRPDENTVVFHTPDGVVVSGREGVTGASGFSSLVTTGTNGDKIDILTTSGFDHSFRIKLRNNFDECADENGEIEVCVSEFRFYCTGSWELDFTN